MKRLSQQFLALVLVAGAPLLSAPTVEDLEERPLIRAMSDELERTLGELSLKDFSLPYYAAFTVFEVERQLCTGRDGGLLQSDRDRVRHLRVDLRVGDWEFDSGNAHFGGFGSGAGGLTTFPVDGKYEPYRRRLWMSADQSYKEAAERLEKKRAVADQLSGIETDVPSFLKVSPVRTAIDGELQDLDGLDCERLATDISGVYGDDPAIEGGRAMISARNVERYFVDSEGALVYEPETTAFADAVGQARAEDGHPVKHFFSRVAHDVEGLPEREKLLDIARNSVDRLKELKAAPRAEFYTGPVLFESDAATQLMWRLLATQLTGTPDPMTDAEADDSDFDPLVARLDRRLLPEAFDVVDDPTVDEIAGIPLIGSYAVDHEGVRSERVELVEDGMLRTLLMSRTPREEIRETNGHGRAASGRVAAKVGNMLFQPEGGLSKSDLRDRLLEEAKKRGLDHGYVVRLLDNSGMTFDAFDRGGGFRGGSDLTPLVVVRIDADGSEKVVRGLSIDRPLIRELDRIVAWGETPHVSNYLVGSYAGTFYGRNTQPMPPVGNAIAVPSLLFAELDMPTRGKENLDRPFLPAPDADDE